MDKWDSLKEYVENMYATGYPDDTDDFSIGAEHACHNILQNMKILDEPEEEEWMDRFNRVKTILRARFDALKDVYENDECLSEYATATYVAYKRVLEVIEAAETEVQNG